MPNTISEGMREKWLDPEYRAAREETAQLRRDWQAARDRAANELFLDPETRPFVSVEHGNEKQAAAAKAYIDAALKPIDDEYKAKLQQIYHERQQLRELQKMVRKSQRETASAERKALFAKALKLRSQARELYRQAHELETKARAGEGPGSQIDSPILSP